MGVLSETQALFEQLVAWRRDLHMHPELGLEEVRTAKLAADTLKALGYEVREGVGETGVVGVLRNGPGPVIMSRVDMDALPIQEENDVPYASLYPGRMHACGHDAHVAIGLGVATLMAQHRGAWSGTLKLIFQPGEEGLHGAERMVKDGALEDPRPEAALAIHVWNTMPRGVFGVAPGPVMAAAEAWEAILTGKGGHAAHPEKTVDPVVMAAMTVMNLQTIVSRNVGAQQTAVVTVGLIQSGDTFNVIPASAVLRGTVRTYDPAVREVVLERLRALIEGTATMMGGQATLDLKPLTPAVVNDEGVTSVVQQVVTDLFGAQALNDRERTMGSEDAAFFLQEIPGCYFFVGSGPADRDERPHHNPRFDIDEGAMLDGVALIVETLRRMMPSEGK